MNIGSWVVPEEFLLNFTSEHTRNNYARDLRQFFEFLIRHFPQAKSFEDVAPSQVLAFRNALMEAGGQRGAQASSKTVARKLASLSSLMNFLVSQKVLEKNPVLAVRRPTPRAQRPTEALSSENVERILQLAKESRTSGPLHHFLLVAFFTTGLRKSELIYRKFGDIKQTSGSWVLEYQGKGGKYGQKKLHPLFLRAYMRYRSWMIKNERDIGAQDWLFQPSKNPSSPAHLNKPLNPKTVNEILSSYGKKLGLGRVCPHAARATFITQLLEEGVDLYQVSQEVQHSSIASTQVYDKRRKGIKESVVERLKIAG